MELVTTKTPKGTPVGARTGMVVHLFWMRNADDVWSLCDRKVRGAAVIREGEEVTCQGCIDERDFRVALNAGFKHNVTAFRTQLGTGAISGSGMRYGAEVTCSGCPDDQGHATQIWFTNESGRGKEAERIARQHYLAKYREHLAAQRPEPHPVESCAHNGTPHVCTHPYMTDQEREIQSRISQERYEEVAAAREAGQPVPSSWLFWNRIRCAVEAAGFRYYGPYDGEPQPTITQKEA